MTCVADYHLSNKKETIFYMFGSLEFIHSTARAAKSTTKKTSSRISRFLNEVLNVSNSCLGLPHVELSVAPPEVAELFYR